MTMYKLWFKYCMITFQVYASLLKKGRTILSIVFSVTFYLE
jgi:hypothetical protein